MEAVVFSNSIGEASLLFIQSWGPLILSAISVIIAIISLFKSSKAQKLQNEVNKNKLEKANKEKDEANKACVQARVIRMGNDNYRLKVWNSGGQTAINVNARFDGNPKILILDADEKIPFEELEPMNSFELILLLHMGSDRKARVITEWETAEGKKESKSQMVDI